MSDHHKPILSICIPTYNRSKFLDSTLSSIFAQLGAEINVEVIVSNNNSTDDTDEVMMKFMGELNLYYYKQKENLGAVQNILKLVADYAKGEYCWVIGDDDFMLQGALRSVINLITSRVAQADYFYASVKGINIKDYNAYGATFNTTMLDERIGINNFKYRDIDKFEELISPEYSIIFLGELMSSIFRRSVWLQHKINGEGVYLDTLETTYPHSVILANTFFGKPACYIESPVLICLDGAREWWDKLGYLLIEQVKNLLDLYESKGLPKHILNKCHKAYILMTFGPFLKFLFNPKSNYRDKINFRRYFKFLLNNPKLLTAHVKSILIARGGILLKRAK